MTAPLMHKMNYKRNAGIENLEPVTVAPTEVSGSADQMEVFGKAGYFLTLTTPIQSIHYARHD